MKRDSRLTPLLDLLLVKYRSDPNRFRDFLPEVAQELDVIAPESRGSRSPFGLTERERAARQEALRKVLEHLEQGSFPREEAVLGLEHCAVLIQDDSLPPEVGYDTLVRLLRTAIGKSPGSIKVVTTFPVQEGQEGKIANRTSPVRGVTLNLAWDMRLVSVTITPGKVQERRKALRFVGIGRDADPEVAREHDKYLALGDPHAAP